jgi:hypothetical protein
VRPQYALYGAAADEAERLRETLRRVVRERNIEVEKLTEDQFVEALRQALPDFQRNVVTGPNGQYGQQVIYLPGHEAAEWKRKYENLLKQTT